MVFARRLKQSDGLGQSPALTGQHAFDQRKIGLGEQAVGQPEREAVDQHRPAGRHVAQRGGEVVRRVDALPALQPFWAERFPFDEGWEG